MTYKPTGEHRRMLKEEFENQADWRRQKACEYPDDERNAAAASRFDQLAATVAECPAEVIDRHQSLLTDSTEAFYWTEMVRRVGFGGWPSTAETLLRKFISAFTGG